jgi:cellulose synthase (UDP-forming)
VPIIYWFTGLNAVQAPLDEILRYFLPYYIAVMITLGWATGGLIQPLLTDVAHVLTMFEALRATVVGLFKPRGHAFKVTPRSGRHRLANGPPLCASRRPYPHRHALREPCGFCALARAVQCKGDEPWLECSQHHRPIDGHLGCVELPRYRREERFATAEPARIRTGDRIFMAPLADVSVSGARIQTPRPGLVGGLVTITLEHVGDIEARIVDGSDAMFFVEFAASDKTRDALIRKLSPGGTVSARRWLIGAG